MILLAKYLSNANINCILDATFATEESRLELRYKMGNDTKEIRIVEPPSACDAHPRDGWSRHHIKECDHARHLAERKNERDIELREHAL